MSAKISPVTDKPGPACRITTLVRWFSGIDPATVGAFAGLAAAVHGKELDGEPNRAQRLDLVLDLVLDPGRDGLGYTRSQLDLDHRVGDGSKSQPALVNDDPRQVAGAIRWARRRPAGMVSWS